MTVDDSGRVGDAEQALVNEAPAGLHPSGFDPSRGDVVLRKEVFDFLMGSAAYDGTWFGDLNDGLPGRFWWRAVLRAAQRESAQAISTGTAETLQGSLRLTGRGALPILRDNVCRIIESAEIAPVVKQRLIADILAQGIEARSDTTRSGVAVGESPVTKECAHASWYAWRDNFRCDDCGEHISNPLTK